MAIFKKHTAENNDWINPLMKGYKMACCDCNLVHNIDFKVIKIEQKFKNGSYKFKDIDDENYRVYFLVSRNNKSTAQLRRYNKNAK